MRPAINLTDVARVCPFDMAAPMNHMIDAGRGLVLLNGAAHTDLRAMEAAIWDRLSPDISQRIATLVRFRCLIQVFSAPGLRSLLLNTGFNLLAPALHVAASLPLNAERGFDAQAFERALSDAVAALETRRPSAPTTPEPPLRDAA